MAMCGGNIIFKPLGVNSQIGFAAEKPRIERS